MLNSAQKAFIQLCESTVLDEDPSQVAKALGSGMAAKAITKFIHSKLSLSDKAEVTQLNGIPKWNDVKNNNSWIILVGDTGMAALRASGDTYTVGAVKLGNSEIQKTQSAHVAEIKAFMKGIIGKVQKYYAIGYREGTSRWSSAAGNKFSVTDIQRKRAQAKAGALGNKQAVSAETIFKKFKPMFFKIIQATEVDIQGMVGTMVKSGNYDSAMNKIQKLKELKAAAEALGDVEPGENDYYARRRKDEADRMLKRKLTRAVEETSMYSYPEMFANEDQPTDAEIQAANKKLFADISAGDSTKLSALLWYFKNGFVR